MARYHKQRNDYPIGSVSSGTMRPEDLIPAFVYELQYRRRNKHGLKRHHAKELREIEKRMEQEDYYEDGDADSDLEWLFNALEEYAGPYFYFGAHPGDGADYGYWLSESWDEDFISVYRNTSGNLDSNGPFNRADPPASIKVNDTADVPAWFRGEVAVVNDHGNVSLYVKTARMLREVWAVV